MSIRHASVLWEGWVFCHTQGIFESTCLSKGVRGCQGLVEHGLSSVMSGMDNVRNMTGSPIAGIDPHEFLDVRPLNYGAPSAAALQMRLLILLLAGLQSLFGRFTAC